jgi:hypothetical protein
MAGYCLNQLTFSGANSLQATTYFDAIGEDAPPFYNLFVEDRVVYFESKWIPPLRDLNELAEVYDVNYDLYYQLPDERQKQRYQYTCMQSETLDLTGDAMRMLILASPDTLMLDALETEIQDQSDLGYLNAHERDALTLLLGKRYRYFSGMPDYSANERKSHPRR